VVAELSRRLTEAEALHASLRAREAAVAAREAAALEASSRTDAVAVRREVEQLSQLRDELVDDYVATRLRCERSLAALRLEERRMVQRVADLQQVVALHDAKLASVSAELATRTAALSASVVSAVTPAPTRTTPNSSPAPGTPSHSQLDASAPLVSSAGEGVGVGEMFEAFQADDGDGERLQALDDRPGPHSRAGRAMAAAGRQVRSESPQARSFSRAAAAAVPPLQLPSVDPLPPQFVSHSLPVSPPQHLGSPLPLPPPPSRMPLPVRSAPPTPASPLPGMATNQRSPAPAPAPRPIGPIPPHRRAFTPGPKGISRPAAGVPAPDAAVPTPGGRGRQGAAAETAGATPRSAGAPPRRAAPGAGAGAGEEDEGDDGRSAAPSRTGDVESLGLGGSGGGSAGGVGGVRQSDPIPCTTCDPRNSVPRRCGRQPRAPGVARSRL